MSSQGLHAASLYCLCVVVFLLTLPLTWLFLDEDLDQEYEAFGQKLFDRLGKETPRQEIPCFVMPFHKVQNFGALFANVNLVCPQTKHQNSNNHIHADLHEMLISALLSVVNGVTFIAYCVK